MQENDIHQLKEITNNLIHFINNFWNEYEEYKLQFQYERFTKQPIFNPKTNSQEKIELLKEETIFDKIEECIIRNENLIVLSKYIDEHLNAFTNKIKQLRKDINDENKKLVRMNNECVDNLNELENNYMKTIGFKIVEKNNDIHKRKVIFEEEENERNKNRVFQKVKESITFEQLKKLEEWINLPIEKVVYDSNEEGIKNSGKEGSSFQNSILNKENLILFIESVEGDSFGCFIKKRIDNLGIAFEDRNGFLFTFKEPFQKFEISSFQTLITCHHQEQEMLLEIGESKWNNNKADILIMKGKENKSFCKSLDSFDCPKDFKLLGKNRETFELKRIVVIQFKETEEMKENNYQKRIKQIEKEKLEIEKISKNVIEKERQKIFEIEKCIGMKMNKLLFHTEVCNWSKHSTVFPELLTEIQNVLILIENENSGNLGCYISIKNNKDMNELCVTSQIVIFTLINNKIQIHENIDDILVGGLKIFNENREKLFEIQNDIVIYKYERRNESHCNMLNIPENIIGNKITPKKIQVFEVMKDENIRPINKIWKVSSNDKETNEKMKLESETKRLKTITQLFKMNPIREIKQLEKWTNSIFESVLFDSDLFDWKTYSIIFKERLVNKQQIVILIETDNGTCFGGYVEKQIDKVNEVICDENTFLFTFKDNQPKKFDILDKSKGFKMYDKSDSELFSFGNGDIIVLNQEMEEISITIENENNFNYNKKQYVLTGRKDFKIKNIKVLQMNKNKISSNKSKEMKFFGMKEKEDEVKRKQYKNQEEKEKELLKQLSKEMKFILPNEIEEIEETTHLKMKQIIFDTEYCDIERLNFKKYVLYKKNLMFLIEVNSDSKIGVFIFDRIIHEDSEKDYISMKNSFLFSYNKKMKIFKQKNSNLSCDLSLGNSNDYLFKIGNRNWNSDIEIIKKDNSFECSCKEFAYNLRGYKNLLLENEKGREITFIPKKIQIIQFYQTSCQKRQKDKLRRKQLEEENEKLNEITNQMNQNEPTNEMIQLQKWTDMVFERVLFDNNCCDWNQYTSTFDERIIRKQNLVFLIEDYNQNIFGGYISTFLYDDDTVISDQNAFLFSIDSDEERNESKKFHVSSNGENGIFMLGSKNSQYLLIFGENDIVINKKNIWFSNKTQPSNNFVYKNKQLIDIETFEIKKLQVWQMKENEQYQNKQEKRNETIEKKYQEELDHLIIETERLKNEKTNEIKKIEQLSKTTFKQLIFDSLICNWKRKTSTFDKHIFNKDKLAFVVENVKGNIFGGYIYENIDKYYVTNEIKWKRESICDRNAFIFVLQRNGKEIEPIKYPIKSYERENAFQLNERDSNFLFSIGNDVVCMKEKVNDKSYCSTVSFVYKNSSTNPKKSPFTIKRIQVYQMEENMYQKQIREKYWKEKDDEIEKEINERIKEEIKQLEDEKIDIQNQYFNEITQIEEWTELKYDSVVYDSDICLHDIDKSTFNKHIMNKKNLVFLIHFGNNNKYINGGFISTTIKSNGKEKVSIVDDKSFLFSFNENIPIKYEIKEDKKNEPMFHLYENWNKKLLSFGNNELTLTKNMNQFSVSTQQNLFDFKENIYPFFDSYNSKIKILIIQLKTLTKQQKVIQIQQTKLNKNLPSKNQFKLIKNYLIKPNDQKKIPKEINQLEQWTQLKFKEILFDSDEHNWNKETSTFDSILIGNEKLVFIIETNNNNIKIGGFINTKINQIGKIEDSNCFIFTNKNNKMIKYSIQKDKSQNAFELYSQQDPKLFTFGNDIIVYKKEMKESSIVDEQNSCFEYGRERKVMIGKIGKFSIKRIQVIQMK